jgi:hypothetical protein
MGEVIVHHCFHQGESTSKTSIIKMRTKACGLLVVAASVMAGGGRSAAAFCPCNNPAPTGINLISNRGLRSSLLPRRAVDPDTMKDVAQTTLFFAGLVSTILIAGEGDKMSGQPSSQAVVTMETANNAALVADVDEPVEAKEALTAQATERLTNKPDARSSTDYTAISKVRKEVASTIEGEMEKEARMRAAVLKRQREMAEKTTVKADSEGSDSTPVSASQDRGPLEDPSRSSTAERKQGLFGRIMKTLRNSSNEGGDRQNEQGRRSIRKVLKKAIAPWRKWENIS